MHKWIFFDGNGPVNDLVKGKDDSVKSKILDLIKLNPSINYAELALKIGVSPSTIKRHIQNLKASGIIFRVGSDKTGSWDNFVERENVCILHIFRLYLYDWH